MASEDLIKSHTLRTHSKKVMNIVNRVITDIDDKNSNLIESLEDLGRRHYIYGATENFLYVKNS